MRNKKKIIRACTVSLSIDFFDEIMKRMREDGYEMVAVTSPGPELDKLREEDGFHCVEVPMERQISLLKDFLSLMRMIKVLWKEKPYIVHSMTPKAGLICMVAGWLTRVPIRIHTFTGLVWPTAVGMKRKILMLTDKILCACATHVIPEGQGVLNDLKDFGVCNKPMKVLGYGNVKGVDMERFDPSRFEKKNDDGTFVFLFVGRIVGDKGINELVEAFSKLHDNYKNAELRLVGRYEKELDPVREETQNIIDSCEGIMVVGPKYGYDLLKEYVNADCFVMPSYREGFPNTVLEAGAMGLPSIVTDINGSREIVSLSPALPHREGAFNDTIHPKNSIKICDNGIIVPPRTIEPLYEAMERMLTDTAMRERMQRNARPMIESRFEKGFVQRCLIEFYDEIMW